MVKAKDIRLKKDYLDCIFNRFEKKAKEIIEKVFKNSNLSNHPLKENILNVMLFKIPEGMMQSRMPIPKCPIRDELKKLASDFREQQEELSDLINKYNSQFAIRNFFENIDDVKKDFSEKTRHFNNYVEYLQLDNLELDKM